MGKTTMIQNMIVADLLADRGICLVDPHGDLADSVVGLVPRPRTNDLHPLFEVNRKRVREDSRSLPLVPTGGGLFLATAFSEKTFTTNQELCQLLCQIQF